MGVLFDNATIVTMNADRDILHDAAMYVDEDRIIEIGDARELKEKYAATADRVIDAKDKVLFPGFINTHSHSVALSCRGRAEDVSNWDAIWGVMGSIRDNMTGDDCYVSSRLAYVEMLKSGITTVADSGAHMLRVGEAAIETGIRAFLHQGFRDADIAVLRDEGRYEYAMERGMRGLQEAVDLVESMHGREDGRIRCLLGPQTIDTVSPELLRATRKEADRLGVGVTIHLSQNEKEPKQSLEAWGDLPGPVMEKAGFLGPDFIGAHAIFLEDADIAALARNGCSISHNPQINAKRAHIAPVSDMIEAGINVGLGSDNMFYDMLEVIKTAGIVWRLRVKDPTVPDPATVVEMATINGARALGIDDVVGSLEEGKVADVVMVNYARARYTPRVRENVLSNLVHFGAADDVALTMVGGRVLVDDHRFVGGNEQTILEEAQQSGTEVWARAKAEWQQRMTGK